MEHSWHRRIKDIILFLLVIGVSVGMWWLLFPARGKMAQVCTPVSLGDAAAPESPPIFECKNIKAGANKEFLY
ncbi:MAG: hypothetical protein AAGG51_11695 [Cyanobacteria bacterium P01_G01_bin.54]